jgi:hypothetical protein
MKYSNDYCFLLSCDANDRLHFIDLEEGTLIKEWENYFKEFSVYSYDTSPDGRFLMT